KEIEADQSRGWIKNAIDRRREVTEKSEKISEKLPDLRESLKELEEETEEDEEYPECSDCEGIMGVQKENGEGEWICLSCDKVWKGSEKVWEEGIGIYRSGDNYMVNFKEYVGEVLPPNESAGGIHSPSHDSKSVQEASDKIPSIRPHTR
ncbi:hypothetical protein C9439_07315, partial [archaeon SCG-AAA382B04]